MATTSSSGLRYPIASDSPNIAQYFQNLATDVDQKVIRSVANPAARTALTATYAGQLVYEQSTNRYYRRNGVNNGWEYAGGQPPAIVACTLIAGWIAIPNRIPVVYKDASGLIHLAGGIRPQSTYNPNDGAPHTAVQLPAGFRPTDLSVPVAAQTSTGHFAGGVIGTDGILNFTRSLSTSIAADVDHYLDNIPPFHPGYWGGVIG